MLLGDPGSGFLAANMSLSEKKKREMCTEPEGKEGARAGGQVVQKPPKHLPVSRTVA